MGSIGGISASWKSEFLVHTTDDGTVCAVIRARDSDLFCAELGSNALKLTGAYRFLGSEGAKLHRQYGRLESPDRVKRSSPGEE